MVSIRQILHNHQLLSDDNARTWARLEHLPRACGTLSIICHHQEDGSEGKDRRFISLIILISKKIKPFFGAGVHAAWLR